MQGKSQYDLTKLKYFVSFISMSGSGHSLLSSMIDAHKNAIVSRECCIFRRVVKKGNSNRLNLETIIRSSEKYTSNGRLHKGSKTSHLVPGQFNGRAYPLLVIGDKNGYGTASAIIRYNPIPSKIAKIPIRYIHVYRNPYDTIAYLNNFYSCSIDSVIKRILRRLQEIHEALLKIKNYLSIKYEDLITDTKTTLRKVLNYLSLEPYNGFIRSCKEIINPTLLHFNQNIDWTKDQIFKINSFCSSIDYLNFALK